MLLKVLCEGALLTDCCPTLSHTVAVLVAMYELLLASVWDEPTASSRHGTRLVPCRYRSSVRLLDEIPRPFL